jgi:hypothetical protein
MGEMLKEISDTKDWSLKRASAGLLSSTDLLSAFNITIHSTVSSPKPALMNTDADFSLVCSEPDNAVRNFKVSNIRSGHSEWNNKYFCVKIFVI